MKTILCANDGPICERYVLQFPCTLKGDECITVKGKVTKTGKPRIKINILEEPTDKEDIHLHFNPRLDSKMVVRNTKTKGTFGVREEDGEMPFVRGEEFEVKFVVRTTHYEIFVNGKKHSDYNHRLPFATAKFIMVHGCLEVNRIEFCTISNRWTSKFILPKRHTNVEFPPQDIDSLDQFKESIDTITDADGYRIQNLEMPFSTPISAKPGKKIYISGIAPVDCDSYAVFLCSEPTTQEGDIMLCAGPRFNYGRDNNIVVLNSKENGSWQTEERPTRFPFEIGKFNNITIEVTKECYKIAINDEHYYDYKHRLPVEKVRYLLINGKFDLRAVRF